MSWHIYTVQWFALMYFCIFVFLYFCTVSFVRFLQLSVLWNLWEDVPTGFHSCKLLSMMCICICVCVHIFAYFYLSLYIFICVFVFVFYFICIFVNCWVWSVENYASSNPCLNAANSVIGWSFNRCVWPIMVFCIVLDGKCRKSGVMYVPLWELGFTNMQVCK